jgi:hypothetical protein
MGVLTKLIVAVQLMLIASCGYADSKTIEFSADAVISVHQKVVRRTKLFVSKSAVRSEATIDGRSMVEIIYQDEGKAVLINKALMSYEERTFDNQKDTTNDNNPCENLNDSVCEKLGAETINGIKTEKWQVMSTKRGQRLRTLLWIDVKRKLAIREFFPDGSIVELKMVKKEKLNGRKTEKWQQTVSRPDGTENSSYQWYDIKLAMVIKEELPGGYVRELKNIKVGRQPRELFAVPDNYRRLDPVLGSVNNEYRSK